MFCVSGCSRLQGEDGSSNQVSNLFYFYKIMISEDLGYIKGDSIPPPLLRLFFFGFYWQIYHVVGYSTWLYIQHCTMFGALRIFHTTLALVEIILQMLCGSRYSPRVKDNSHFTFVLTHLKLILLINWRVFISEQWSCWKRTREFSLSSSISSSFRTSKCCILSNIHGNTYSHQ
jgi:hypothetical protein